MAATFTKEEFFHNFDIERMNNTCRRMCVPEIPAEDVLQAIKALVDYEKEWVPHSDGTSLYMGRSRRLH